VRRLAAGRIIGFVHRLRTRIPGWKWLIGFAFVWGLVPVVMASTVHNRCSRADPACIFHSYTLADIAGPWILGVVGAPALLSLVVAMALHMKAIRRSFRAEHAAWCFAVLSGLICLVGLVISGFVVLIPGALTVCAVAVTPLPPDPSDPLAGSGAGYSDRGQSIGHDNQRRWSDSPATERCRGQLWTSPVERRFADCLAGPD
jgi:hypothetical protein